MQLRTCRHMKKAEKAIARVPPCHQLVEVTDCVYAYLSPFVHVFVDPLQPFVHATAFSWHMHSLETQFATSAGFFRPSERRRIKSPP